MRILLVTDHYPPFIGGAQRQSQLLAHELVRRGHIVDVVAMCQPGSSRVEDDGGIPVHRIRQMRDLAPKFVRRHTQRYHPPFWDPLAVWDLRNVLARTEPDLVHAYGWIAHSCALALRGRTTPLLLTARDYGYACATRTLMHLDQVCSGPGLSKCVACAAREYGVLKGSLAAAGVRVCAPVLRKRVNGLHSISSYVRQVTERDFLFDSERPIISEVIPSFMAEESLDRPLDPKFAHYLSRLPREPFLLFVGALRRVKGIEQLFAAYQRLPSPPPLVLIGTIERDTPPEFPPGVTALEGVPHPVVIAAWTRCLLGVLPSLLPEPLGSVVYEGMMCGKAVIGTVPGGHADMITDGETGLLVPCGNVDALEAAMRRLIADGALRQRLGAAAHRRAEAFTARVAGSQFERLYRELLG
jgi:glycosyltransferase involved in cell wall biosynthesis